MNAPSVALVVLLCGACASSSKVQTSGGNGDGIEGASGNRDPLVGSWTFSGSVPARIGVTLTFGPDKAFTMVETVTPWGQPAGIEVPLACITMDTYLGTYAEGVASGTSTLNLTFTGGTDNAVVGCDAGSAGTPMTPDTIAAYRTEGLVPAAMNAYTVNSTTLVLTPIPSDPRIAGLATQATTFTKRD